MPVETLTISGSGVQTAPGRVLTFLARPTPPAALDRSIAMSEEARMMASAVRAFMEREVLPRVAFPLGRCGLA
jgi:hypothetical protein